MSDVEDVLVGTVASVVAADVAALVAIVDAVVVVRFGSDRMESNNNLRLVVIVVTADDVDEAWAEPPSGSAAAISTSLLFEEVSATARPCLSRSKAGEMSASPGKRLFLLATAAGCGSRAELLLLFVVRLLVAAAAVPPVIEARDLLPSSLLGVSPCLGLV